MPDAVGGTAVDLAEGDRDKKKKRKAPTRVCVNKLIIDFLMKRALLGIFGGFKIDLC
jgi:hypothetical protein